MKHGLQDMSDEDYTIEKNDYKYISCVNEINKCILSLEDNFDVNIQLFTELCEKLLGRSCTIYNRQVGNMLFSCGQYQDALEPDADDKRIIGIIASAISVEEGCRKTYKNNYDQEQL